jgi:hypothetical protein
MKKTTQQTVTVGLDAIRTVLATAMSDGIGTGDPKKVQLDIGEKDDGYGFPESGTLVLRKATLVVQGDRTTVGGLDVVPETTVEMDQAEVVSAIAAHVEEQMRTTVLPQDVHLFLTPRHQGDHGYEGPFLDRAVVAVKSK